MVAGGAATVVVLAWRFGEHRERPPVTCVGKALAADFAGVDVVASVRDAIVTGAVPENRADCSDRRIMLIQSRFAEFAEHTGSDDRAQARRRAQNRRLRMLVELAGSQRECAPSGTSIRTRRR